MNQSKNSFTVSKHISRVLCLGILFCLVLSCTGKKKAPISDSSIKTEINSDAQQRQLTDEIQAQEKAWAAALVSDDLNFVASIMHNDFRLIRAYGDAPPISKEMYLGMKGMSASSAQVTSVNISTKMDSIVVARVTWTLDWEQEGVGKLPPNFDMIDTWKKNENGIWHLIRTKKRAN
jgi:ketosteroid isomerase-like protein